jgi:WD40 repeat protein
MSDAFLSYSRRDSEFVRRLYADLVRSDVDVWVDWDGIPATAEWPAELIHAIQTADNVVFVVSPESVRSEQCLRELEHARVHNKRIVSIVWQAVDPESMPEAIRTIQWISFERRETFDHDCKRLVDALRTDLEWVRAHTRLVVRSVEWQARRRDDSLLLRGRDLDAAEEWLARSGAALEPRPTEDQIMFVRVSRQSSTRRQRRLLGGLSVGLVITTGLAILALLLRNESERQRLLSVSRELAAYASANISIDREQSVLLAIEASRAGRTTQAEQALVRAVSAYPDRIALEPPVGKLRSIAFSPDSSLVVGATESGTVHLWRVDSGQLLAELSSPHDPVQQVAFSPNGQLIMTRGAQIHNWSSMTRELVAEIHDSAPLQAAAFSPDSESVITAAGDGSVRAWTSKTGSAVGRFVGHSGAVRSLAFSPDGQRLVTAGDDGVGRVWDTHAGTLLTELVGHKHRLIRTGFSRDGRLVVTAAGTQPINAEVAAQENSGLITSGPLTGGRRLGSPEPDNSVRVWEVASGKQIGVIRPYFSFVLDAAFGPDNVLTVTSSSRTNVFRPQDYAGAQLGIGSAQLEGESPAFSPDGNLIGTIVLDNSVHLRHMNTQQTAGIFPGSLMAFSPDGRRLLTATPDGSGFLWHLDSDAPGDDLRKSVEAFSRAQVSGGGALIATISTTGQPRLWDGRTGSTVSRVRAPGLEEQTVVDLAIRPDGKALLTIDDSAVAVLWDLDHATRQRLDVVTGAVRADFSSDGRSILVEPRYLNILQGDRCVRLYSAATATPTGEICDSRAAIASAHFSDGGQFVVTMANRTAHVWDSNDGHLVMQLALNSDTQRVLVTADGTRLITAAYSNVAQLWEIGSARHIADVRTYENDSSSGTPDLKLSADGRLLMSRGDRLNVWDTATGQHLAGWDASSGNFSPDGRLVTTVRTTTNDSVAHVWNALTGREVAALRGHTGTANWATFSSDGRWVVTVGSEGSTVVTGGEGSVRLWDSSTGREISRLRDPEGGVVSAALAVGGRWLLTRSRGEGGDRIRIHSWEQFAPIDEVLAVARGLVARELDGWERAQFIHE